MVGTRVIRASREGEKSATWGRILPAVCYHSTLKAIKKKKKRKKLKYWYLGGGTHGKKKTRKIWVATWVKWVTVTHGWHCSKTLCNHVFAVSKRAYLPKFCTLSFCVTLEGCSFSSLCVSLFLLFYYYFVIIIIIWTLTVRHPRLRLLRFLFVQCAFFFLRSTETLDAWTHNRRDWPHVLTGQP